VIRTPGKKGKEERSHQLPEGKQVVSIDVCDLSSTKQQRHDKSYLDDFAHPGLLALVTASIQDFSHTRLVPGEVVVVNARTWPQH
jgi:hypothetical protein